MFRGIKVSMRVYKFGWYRTKVADAHGRDWEFYKWNKRIKTQNVGLGLVPIEKWKENTSWCRPKDRKYFLSLKKKSWLFKAKEYLHIGLNKFKEKFKTSQKKVSLFLRNFLRLF